MGAHSFLALAQDQRTLYATSWTEPPAICAYSVPVTQSDPLNLLNSLVTKSRSGYVACSATTVYSAGGASGECYTINPDGFLKSELQQLKFVDSAGQKDNGSVMDFGGLRHGAHSIDLSHDGTEAYVADIGRNCVFTYLVNATTGALEHQQKFLAPEEGDGPRHTTTHPKLPYLYVVQEHSSRIDTYLRTKSSSGVILKLISRANQLPSNENATDFWSDEVRSSTGADPKYLYASTRGLTPATKGYITIYTLNDGIPDPTPLKIYQTETSGGWANAIEPAPMTVSGLEVLALTDSEAGTVKVLTFDGAEVREVGSVELPRERDANGTIVIPGAATAVWRRPLQFST